MNKWIDTTIEEVLKNIQTGTTPRKSISKYYENGSVNWYSPSDFNDNTKFLENAVNKISEIAVKEKKARMYKPNTILLVGIGTVGRVGLLKEVASSNQQITGLVFNENINAEYAYYWIRHIRSTIEANSSNAVLSIINQKAIKRLPFKYPKSIEEQRRIVSKLDGLFAEIDASLALIDQNIAQAEALLGSYLDQKFKQANAENIPLEKLSNKVQYGYTGKSEEKGEYYYLRITDIQNGRVDYSKTPFSNIPLEDVPKFLLKKGDILFARTGATAGKSYLFNDDRKAVFASYLIRVDVKRELLSPKYLKWFFQSDNYWAQIYGNIVGAAQPNFNGTRLKKLIVPVPKIETQIALAEQFEEMNNEVEQLTFRYIKKQKDLEALKSSLLDQAFKGEL